MSGTFSVVLRQLVAPAGESQSRLAARAAARLGCAEKDILSCQPVRKALDARKRRGGAVNVYHLRLTLPAALRPVLRRAGDPDIVFEAGEHRPGSGSDSGDPPPVPGMARPLVVGAGPAGLFAALRLARAGWRPLLIERGDNLAERSRTTAAFWRFGELDPESNALYGLGGAGLFSDGKLNTRHKDREGLRNILGIMTRHGAPESILLDAQPHVGSDRLGGVVAGIAAEIVRLGGEIRCRARLVGLRRDGGRLRGATLTSGGMTETLAAGACVLAAGHSARDTYEMLYLSGVAMEAKSFAVGLRVEMPQAAIDLSQRAGPGQPGAGEAASFRLSRAAAGGAAACYTFCMCPGGQVIACASEPGRLAVNGMSRHARAGDLGNAAFLTPATAADCAAFAGGDTPPALAGLAFQRHWEERAWLAGGGAYAVPAARLEDFTAGRTGDLPAGRSVDRAVPADLRKLLPEGVVRTLAEAIPAMLRRLRRVRPEDVVLYGVETRTSSPVRVSRNDRGESESFPGLYPAGEGSGYAGGIMTSALDGWNCAGTLMRNPAGA